MVNSRARRYKVLLLTDNDKIRNQICGFCESVHQDLIK